MQCLENEGRLASLLSLIEDAGVEFDAVQLAAQVKWTARGKLLAGGNHTLSSSVRSSVTVFATFSLHAGVLLVTNSIYPVQTKFPESCTTN